MKTITPLRDARQRAGLSQAELASRLGVSLGWIGVIERAPGLASPELLARLASALGVPAEALTAGRRRAPAIF